MIIPLGNGTFLGPNFKDQFEYCSEWHGCPEVCCKRAAYWVKEGWEIYRTLEWNPFKGHYEIGLRRTK